MRTAMPTAQDISDLLTQAGFTRHEPGLTGFRTRDADGVLVAVDVLDGDGLLLTGDDAFPLLSDYADTIEDGGYWAWLDHPGLSVIAWDENIHGHWENR